MTGHFRRLLHDRGGAALVEFAFVAPIMMVLIMGLSDLLFQSYAQAVLTGEVQKAARDSAIEGGAANAGTIDAKVISRMAPLLKGLTPSCATTAPANPVWCSTRKSYDSFANVAPEPFTDANADGIRNPGECFTDLNGNKAWDADPGVTGQGGAGAVTTYTMAITFPRIFPVAGLLGWSPQKTIRASTVLKNQPYAAQTTTTPQTVCT